MPSAGFLTLLLCQLATVSSYKILITSLATAKSQNIQMGRLADILSSRGHETTLLSWNLFPSYNVELKTTNQIRVPFTEDSQRLQAVFSGHSGNVWNNLFTDLPLPFLRMLYEAPSGCSSFLENEQRIKNMKAEKYDMIIIQFLDGCSFGLAHVLGIETVVSFSTTVMTESQSWHAGVPYPASVVPSWTNAQTDQMQFLSRLKNLFKVAFMHVAFHMIDGKYTDSFQQKYGADFPSIPDLMKETDLYLLNSDPFLDIPKPTLHNVLYVGGMMMQNPEPLDAKWQKIINNVKVDGAVLFSLGTFTDTSIMPAYVKKAFLDAFKRFPTYTFICKLTGDFPEAKNVENILIIPDHFPQKDLLAHPRVKAFITHGGYNSFMEAGYAGVPLVVLPLFSDQYANAKRVKRLGIGKKLNKMTLTVSKVEKALNMALKNETVIATSKRLARMVQSKPVSSLELAVKWLEFAAEYKNLDILKPEARKMSLVEYYMLDVFALLFALWALGLWIMLRTCQCCYRKLFAKKAKTD